MKKSLILLLTVLLLAAFVVEAKPKRKNKKRTKTRTEKVQEESLASDTIFTEIKIVGEEEIPHEIHAVSDTLNVDNPMDEEIYWAVEEPAEFIGDVNEWLAGVLTYPPSALENDIQGRVTVKFCVEKDGSITQVSIVRGADPDLNEEALRVVKAMPNWQPAKDCDKVVRTWVTIPITFRITDPEPEPSSQTP